MGKLLYTVVPIDEVARKALLALLPAEQQQAYAHALDEQDPALLLVLGKRAEVASLNEQIREGEGAVSPAGSEAWLPEPLSFQLPGELGELRREELYES